MANAIAFPSFNDLGRTVTRTFLSRNRFYLQLKGRGQERPLDFFAIFKVLKNS